VEKPKVEDEQNIDEQMAFGLEKDKSSAERSKVSFSMQCSYAVLL